MNFRVLREFPSPAMERAWREYLSRVEVPAHYDSPEYFLDPLPRQTVKRFAVLALDGDQVRGVLTGFREGKEVMSGLACRPQICVDGTDSAATLQTLAEGLLEEAGAAELVTVHTWPSLELQPFSKRGFRRRELTGSVVLDLTRGPDALFGEFTKDRRRNIRFAEKHGVEVREAASDQDIMEAYQVHRTWCETGRKTIHGKRSFEHFSKGVRLTNNHLLLLATLAGKVIAINTFRFCPGGLFESSTNCSLEEFIHLKPNDLLQWRGIQWACAHGLRRHSLGGAHSFLLRFGGSVVPVVRYRLDRTFLARHELKESVRAAGRFLLDHAPAGIGQAARRLRHAMMSFRQATA